MFQVIDVGARSANQERVNEMTKDVLTTSQHSGHNPIKFTEFVSVNLRSYFCKLVEEGDAYNCELQLAFISLMFLDANSGLASFIQLLLNNIDTVKIDSFTKWDRDRLNELESIFTIIC